jgi:hypothetical protein
MSLNVRLIDTAEEDVTMSPLDNNSTTGLALPFKYLLPTPHHGHSSEGSTVQGLSYFLDSTCDSGRSDVGGSCDTSTRVEYPSGVEPLVTPQWQRGQNLFQV